MTRFCLILALAFSLAFAVTRFVPAQGNPKKSTTQEKSSPEKAAQTEAAQKTGDRSADEKAIHDNIVAFAKAYNAGDAKAVAALFAEDGQVVTLEVMTIEGRSAIEEGFQEVFAETPDAEIEVIIDSLRFIGADLAVEVGATKEWSVPGEAPVYGRYTVLHVKRDGKWLMALARDTAGEPPTNRERLEPLAWMVGEWIDDGGTTVVHTKCDWSKEGNFLLQEMTVQVAGQDVMQVTQRIGWDPRTKKIHSWVFDTEGGFAEGVWTRLEGSWVIKSTGVRSDGTTASATNVIVPTGKDGYVWRVHDRILGEETQPALEIKVVRKPPTPATAGK